MKKIREWLNGDDIDGDLGANILVGFLRKLFIAIIFIFVLVSIIVKCGLIKI